MEITNNSIKDHLDTIESKRRPDIEILVELFKSITKKEPKLWGTIIGFGNLHYKYKTGHEGHMPILGLANRTNAITLYLTLDTSQYKDIDKLGKIKVSKSCIYIKKVSDIDLEILTKICYQSIEDILKLDYITEI